MMQSYQLSLENLFLAELEEC